MYSGTALSSSLPWYEPWKELTTGSLPSDPKNQEDGEGELLKCQEASSQTAVNLEHGCINIPSQAPLMAWAAFHTFTVGENVYTM
ncbi:hypothetical protein FKM82_003384 [Ascaphus truei]